MIILTALAIIVAGLTGAAIYWQAQIGAETLAEIKKGGTDTHDLAVAAKSQADAAKATADSAKVIAASALTQATATNYLANQAKRQADIATEALRSNIESANQDRRPWVGLQSLQCNNCRQDTDGSAIIGELSAVLVNTGKTPAIDMVVSWTFESTKASDPIPTYDMIEKDREAALKRARTVSPNLPPDVAADIAKTMSLVERDIAPPREVLAPNAARGITIIAGLKQGRNRMARMEDTNVVYGLGKITYYDTSHTVQHTTTFCVMNKFATLFQYCPTGNEMN
jgi:hypothetical protein